MTYRYASKYALRAIQLALLVEAIIRGWNYIATPPEQSTLWLIAQESAPLWAWGTAFIVLGFSGLAGEWWMDAGTSEHRSWPSFLSHIGLMFLFGTFAVSAIIGVTERNPIYGFGAAFDLLLFAAGHWIFARRHDEF